MRIIGDASQQIEKRVICKNCGVELGYLPIDIKKEQVFDYGGGTDTYKVISCPNCQKTIQV